MEYIVHIGGDELAVKGLLEKLEVNNPELVVGLTTSSSNHREISWNKGTRNDPDDSKVRNAFV